MREVDISTASRQYSACIGPGAIARLNGALHHASAVVVVCDDVVAGLHGACIGTVLADVVAPVHHWTVPAGEESKSWWQAEALLDFLCSHEVDRQAAIVAVGGGVVGDLAGFVASIWLRGIEFINCPTTLLAAVDSSIGGKTALNHGARKNLIGTIHQPAAVFIDTDLLATLSARQWNSALAESIKQAALDGPGAIEWHENNLHSVLQRDPEMVSQLIEFNIGFKGSVVARDETDRTGARALLNFGHTIGHGIEAACDYQLTHGECVAIGMVGAIEVGAALGRRLDAMRSGLSGLLHRCELPVAVPEGVSEERILLAMRADKKCVDHGPRFVLPRAWGEFEAGVHVPWAVVEDVLGRLR